MERLKASFKSIQGAIMAPMGPICIQEAKTESFRGDYLLCSTSYTHPRGSPPPCEDDDSTSTQLPSSSLSLSSDRHRRRGDSDELFVHPVTSERFFFTPCTSKSIIVETEYSDELARCERIAVLSEDPYRDFLASMEEVAAAHELREWRGLQELLRCYLRLNERKNHKAIVLAFVDLLMHLVEQDKLRGLLSNCKIL